MHEDKCVLVNDIGLLELTSCEKLPPAHGQITFQQTGGLLTEGKIM